MRHITTRGSVVRAQKTSQKREEGKRRKEKTACPPTTSKKMMAQCASRRRESGNTLARKALGQVGCFRAVPAHRDPTEEEKRSPPAYLPGAPQHRRAASGLAKWEWSLPAPSGKPEEPRQRPWAHCQTHKLSPGGSRDPCLKKAHKIKISPSPQHLIFPRAASCPAVRPAGLPPSLSKPHPYLDCW